MKKFIKNATRGVAFLFDVIKDLIKLHINIFTFHKSKSARRFLAGAVALILIFATLLSDVSVAYAQTDNDFVPFENIVFSTENEPETNEEPAEQEKKDEVSEHESSETESSETESSEAEESKKEDPQTETPEASTPAVEEPSNDETSSDKPDDEKTSVEAPVEEIKPVDTPADVPSNDESSEGESSKEETEGDENADDTLEETEEEELKEEESEEEDEDETPEKMPAISISQTVDDYEIRLECSEGTFAEGTTVEIKKVEGESKEEADKLVEDAITENVSEEEVDIVKIVAFDITFYDKDGKVVEPADRNSVSVKITPSDQDKAELESANDLSDEELLCSVFHIEDDEKVEEIECESADPVEEVTFEAESFSVYSIVWYQKGDDGEYQESELGPESIGGYVKSRHSFIDFTLPVEFTNEGTPVDTSLRPQELEFEIYGRDATDGAGIDHEEVLICKISVPIVDYNPTSKTISLKKSGEKKTEIPIYVQEGTQAKGDDGSGKLVIDGFEYTAKLVGTGESSIYSVKEDQDSTAIEISSIANEVEWSGLGKDKLVAERQSLSPKKFYVSWIDNRNKEGVRPYSEIDDFTSEAAKDEFKSTITLYRQVGDGAIEPVTNDMVPTKNLADAGPTVGRKDGKSISDWEITYKNLPMVSDGKTIKYYITVNDSNFKNNYTTVMPEGSKAIDGLDIKAFLSDTTVKYIYSEDFTAKVEWYDAENTYRVRLTPENLAKEFVITDDNGDRVFVGENEWDDVEWLTTGDTATEWSFKIGPLPMYNEQGAERAYNLVLKDGLLKVEKTVDEVLHKYEYSVDYSNVPKSAAHENCLSGGKIILVIDRPLDSFSISKNWIDDHDYERRKEAVEAGVRFLLWRYPLTKKDGTPGTPADRAAVFDPETHTQYTYTLKMSDPNVAEGDNVKDSIPITLKEFGVSDDQTVDMFDQNGVQYVYFATEVISKTGYKTVYSDVGDFSDYSEYGVMNGGMMTNVRQEKMKMEGIVKWNVPSINDYTKATVTIELQKYNATSGTWETLPKVGDKVYSKTLSGFTVTNPKSSHIFPEVDRYDENGMKIEYRIVQTKVNYLDADSNLVYTVSPTDSNRFTSEYEMGGKNYTADAAPTLNTADSYTIENRLAGETELTLIKHWLDNNDKGFGKTDIGCLPYENITIKVFQHGVVTNYNEPYMTITTTGSGDDFNQKGESVISGNTVPCTIVCRDTDKNGDGIIHVTEKHSDGRAKKWEFKDKEGNNIFLPAFNDNGNAYSYTIEESHVEGAYTEYSYVISGNDLTANVSNKYVVDGGDVRTIVFQKEWVDGTDIPQEKPVKIAIVRIDEHGNFIYTADNKIDLTDKLGKTHITTLTNNNNWYNQLGINLDDNSFESIDIGGGKKKYLYTAIELSMAQNGTTDFTREVKYDTSAIASKLQSDMNGSPCNEFYGSIDAYLDSSHEENHLPGYDVTVKSSGASVIDSSKYIVINKRKGVVNVVFNKKWQDGSNSEGTRTGVHKVYLYQNGKKVVAEPSDLEKEVHIEGITSPAEKEYSEGLQEDTHEFKFEGLPQYDDNGNIYHYSVKEFLAISGNEIEIALTDTKDSSKTGYIVTDYSEKTHYSRISDNSILERKDTYNYTNTITGEKTGGAKFYVLWHDQSSYDKGIRPDVNYVLYYKVKGSDQEPQVYNGEYKSEWHPMYDSDTGNASRYYQYINFTRLPIANDEGMPYEYYAIPSLNNPGNHYDEAFYAENDVVMAKDGDRYIYTSAGRHHYDINPAREVALRLDTNMLPENGIVEYTIDELINIKGNKLWKLDDNGDLDPSKLPDAKIYLWRESDHDKRYIENSDVSKRLDESELNEDKKGYEFKTGDKDTEYPKYDRYGQVYKYTVTEKIYVNSPEKYQYSIPNYVMNFKPETNGITNVYTPENEHNHRKIKVTKQWDWNGFELGAADKKPVAEFRLYRVEVPLNADYYKTETDISGNSILSANPKKAAYDYAINELKKYKAGNKGVIEELGKKSIAYDAAEQFAVWDNLPIYASSGLVYLYFTEEINTHGMDSFRYDVLTEASADRPAVRDIDAVYTGSDKTNILISDNKIDKARAVLFSNFGLNPLASEDDSANCQEAGYQNTFKESKSKTVSIAGYKTWNDGIFTDTDDVRPKIVNNKCPEVILTLTRSAATQTGYGNAVSEKIDSSKYEISWEEVSQNKWKFVLTPKDADEFKLYATNGRAYTYTVTESISGNTLANYKISNKTVSGSVKTLNEAGNVMTLSPSSSLQNSLKGQIKVFKKWDDAFNELNLRSGFADVVLQYRIVPEAYGVGEYNGSDSISQWKNYRNEPYKLVRDGKWEQTVNLLPVKTQNGYRYEYRLLETAFKDIDVVNPVTIDSDGNATYYLDENGEKVLKNVPKGGLCTDSTPDPERNILYGNSTSPEGDYKNKCFEIKIGNYLVNNSPILSLASNSANVSSMELRVDNRLVDTVSLKIEKRWTGVNVGEELVAPEDTYGVLPDKLVFKLERKKKNEPDSAWAPLLGEHGEQVSIEVEKKENSYVQTITERLPRTAEDGQVLVYRAIEQTDNLKRFKDNPTHVHETTVDGTRTICHSTVTNTMEYRNITIQKKWNAEDKLRKPVTVELYSDNFKRDAENDTFDHVQNTEKTLNADNGWEVTYKNLPEYNTDGHKIRYYVMESQVDNKKFNINEYAIHFFGQTGETDDDEHDYYEVIDRYSEDGEIKVNIAPINDAYKMYIVNTPKTSLTVSKKWNDEDNRQGLRANVKVTLSHDGVADIAPYGTDELTPVEDSSVTWKYLPIYKNPDVNFIKGSAEHTDKIDYIVTEADTLKEKGYEIPEYSFDDSPSISANGERINLSDGENKATITNTYHPPKIKFTASKNWVDEADRHFSRPNMAGIHLTLYYSTDNKNWNKVTKLSSDYAGKNYPDGSNVYTISNVTQLVTDNGTDKWGSPVWEGLPTKVANKPIYYKAFETDSSGKIGVTPGYSASYAPESINVSSKVDGETVSQEITNTLVRTSMLLSKEWKDSYDVSDRPDAVSFVLEYRRGAVDNWRVYRKADGTVLKVTLTGDNHKSGSSHIWETEVDDLPSMDSTGTKYEYRVKEISIAYGSNEVRAYGIRDASEISNPLFTHEGDTWKSESTVGAFENSVVSAPYQVSKDNKYSYKVTAVNTPITGKLTVVKKWDDENNRDGLRPDQIKLQLYRRQDEAYPVKYGNAVVVGPGRDGTTVSEDKNEWSYTFDNLPVYNNDAYEHTEEHKSIYYVMEVNSEHGYEVSYTPETGATTVNYDDADNILMDNSDNTYSTTEIITNKYNPVRIKIQAHKEWMDDNNSHEKRPEKLDFKLQYRIAGEEDWEDVSYVSSDSVLDKSGMKVETTSPLNRTITGSVTGNEWNKDIDDKSIIWENLPAYVNNGMKVEYRIEESDSAGTDDAKKISKNYKVEYDHCKYEETYGEEYSLKATNILIGMGKILTIEKTWTPDKKDDITTNDKVITKIKCHLEFRDKDSVDESAWTKPTWGYFELSHSDNWQHILVQTLTSSNVYRIIEDAIVYEFRNGGGEVTVDAVGNRVGSFEWAVNPKNILASDDPDEIEMQATITNTIPDNSITVTKVWDDENDREGKRPHSITMRLKRDGHTVSEDVILYPKEDKVNSVWDEHTWHNLPIYKNGVLIDGELVKSEYTVEEVVDGEFTKVYQVSYKVDDGTPADACGTIEFSEFSTSPNPVKVEVTNRHETHKEKVTASKKWVDDNNKYKSRPKNESGEYHTYLMLLYKLANNTYWEPINFYSDYADFEKRGYQYPDHHVYTTSPRIQEVTGNTDDKWENVAVWENVSTRGIDGELSASNTDQDVLLKVIEVPSKNYDFLADSSNPKDNPISIAPKGYTVSAPETFDPEHEKVSEEHAEVTNTLITTKLEVEKTWTDHDNQFNTRPEKIRVKLERKLDKDKTDLGKQWYSVEQIDKDDTILEISAANEWKCSFEKLPLYDQNGDKYIYRAVETAMIYGEKEVALDVIEPDYGITLKAEGGNYISNMETTSEGDVSNPSSFKYAVSMNNILKDSDDDTTSITVIKKWKDENNRDGIRPTNIKVNLLRDGVKVDTKTITGPSWEYTWDKLPLWQNGYTKGLFSEKSIYTVTEETIESYEVTIAKSDDNQYTITNTHIPKKAVITADKVWKDSKNTYLTRPKEIYLRLLYKYASENDSEYRIVPEYSREQFEDDGMYTSSDAEGVFTTSKATQKCSGKDDEDWVGTAKWENLPIIASPNSEEYEPKPVVYKVIEVEALDTDSSVITSKGAPGYEVTDVSVESESLNTDKANNVKIINSLTNTELNITKAFDDGENKYNTRPDSIEVQVLRRIKSASNDGEWQPVKVKGGLIADNLFVTLTKADNYSKKLTDLPKYDKDGNEYEYTCLEKNLIFGSKKTSVEKSNVTPAYTVSGNDVAITNTLITTSLTVEKVWEDNSNKRKSRPEKIVFVVERKETKDILSQIISKLTELLTGKDGYSELKTLKDGKEETVEIVIEGPDFKPFTLEGLPAYSEDGNLYSYRAIETKFVYATKVVSVEKGTSLYKKPTYQFDVLEAGKDARGNTAYKYYEKVVNKIIPIKNDPEPTPTPQDPSPSSPTSPVTPSPVKPPSKYEIIDDTDPKVLPSKVTEKIYELIDLPDDNFRKVKVMQLYNDLLKILQEDPTFIDKLDPETADIVKRFLASGVLGRKRARLPQTGGVVGSVMLLLLGSILIGLGVALRTDEESDKKKRQKK